jgi:hypothetical protein
MNGGAMARTWEMYLELAGVARAPMRMSNLSRGLIPGSQTTVWRRQVPIVDEEKERVDRLVGVGTWGDLLGAWPLTGDEKPQARPQCSADGARQERGSYLALAGLRRLQCSTVLINQ